MKTLKLMTGIFLLIAMCSACKKDKVNVNDPGNLETAAQITKADLLSSYIVAERKTGDMKLTVLTFAQEGDNLRVNLHRQGYLRILDVNLSNNTLSFNLDETGNYTYTFVFEKSENGKLNLKSYQYTDKTNTAQGLAYAVLASTNSSQSFENANFKTGEILFSFNSQKAIDWDIKQRQVGTKYYPPPINQTLPVMGIAPEISVPYYTLVNGSFKANSDFIGTLVPSWKATNTTVMVLEHNNIIYQADKQ